MRTEVKTRFHGLKIHHSIGDRTSLMSLILARTRKTSDPDSLPSLPQPKRPASVSRDRTGLRRILFCIWWGLVLLWNTLVDMVAFAMTVLFLKDTGTPVKGKPGVEFNPKRIVYEIFSLEAAGEKMQQTRLPIELILH